MYDLLGSGNIWLRYNSLKMVSECAINLNIEKIAFKVVQKKFLAMHITNKKLHFYIFMVRHLQNVFMEYDLYLIS